MSMNKQYQQYLDKHIMVNWESLSEDTSVPEDVLYFYKDKVNWDKVLYARKISRELIEKLKDVWGWRTVLSTQDTDLQFLEKYESYIDEDDRYDHHDIWDALLYAQDLSEDILDRFFDKFDQESLMLNQKVSEEFINRHIKDLYCWKSISEYQKLSEDFIRKHAKDIHWLSLIHNPCLTEKTIKNYSHHFEYGEWRIIFKDRSVSEKYAERIIRKYSKIYSSEDVNSLIIIYFFNNDISLRFYYKYKKYVYKRYRDLGLLLGDANKMSLKILNKMQHDIEHRYRRQGVVYF